MTIYQVTDSGLSEIESTSFADAGFRERDHIQQLLKRQIDVIAPDTRIISEEFGDWEDSRRRIDLLGVDKEGNLVVIELKRTQDGGHMDLQSIRYAAMVSTMTFDGAVDVFERYLSTQGQDEDARERLLEFLEWDEPDEEQFAQDVRIILAGAEFSKEITTSVLWLNEHGLDIRCIRMKPYRDGEKLMLDIQSVIPLPEAEEYQVRIHDKVRLERVSRTRSRDLTKYDVTVGGETLIGLPKRRVPWRKNILRGFEGRLDSDQFKSELAKQLESEGKKPLPRRFFIEDDELIHGRRASSNG